MTDTNGTDIVIESAESTERFERFVALANGQYWRSKITTENKSISAGHILMIQQIDDVDNRPHTIHIRRHPSVISQFGETEKFLVQEFLDNFEHVEEHIAEASRDNDIKAIQDRIKASQDELTSSYTDPLLMNRLIDEEMPKEVDDSITALPIKHEALGSDIVGAVKSRNLANLMSKGLTSNGVDQIKSGLEEQKGIAVRRADWIKMRTSRLTRMANEMTPYFEEKAALQIALSKDMMDHVSELMKGIASLNLYVLKNVDIETLREGPSATDLMPLTITQRVLYMDDELAVFEEVHGDFDFENRNQFCEALVAHPKLVDQIFPTERCIVSLATTKKHHDYTSRGYSPHQAEERHKENLRQFLFVRDGQNLHVVLSPEMFHNYSKTLFPTTWENEKPFKGWDGSTITYNDLDYTKALEEHERISLGYKRLLILLCGLDHNKRLFGEFYSGMPSMDFVSLEFQEKHFNFIHDMDGEGLISTHRPANYSDWVAQQNKFLTPGCSIMMRWHSTFNRKTIPAAIYSHFDHDSIQYSPTQRFNDDYVVCRVRRKGNQLIAQIEVEGDTSTSFESRTFNATFNVTAMLKECSYRQYIVIDGLNLDDAAWYLHDRPSRDLNATGIRMLKNAMDLARKQQVIEQPVKEKLLNAILEGDIADRQNGSRLADKALATWRCAKPSKDVLSLLTDTRAFNLVLDQIFTLQQDSQSYIDMIKLKEQESGRELYRLSILANGNFAAYSSTLDNERDDRIVPFDWVHRTVYQKSKRGVNSKAKRFTHLLEKYAGETPLFEIDDIKQHIASINPFFTTPEAKQKALSAGDGGIETMFKLQQLQGNKEAVLPMIDEYLKVRRYLTFELKENTQYVEEPYAYIVIGHAKAYSTLAPICFSVKTVELLVWLCGENDELLDYLARNYAEIYSQGMSKLSRLKAERKSILEKPFLEMFHLAAYTDVQETTYSDLSFTALAYFREVPGYRHSLSKRFEDNIVYIPDCESSSKSIDQLLGVTVPENHFPCRVRTYGHSDTDTKYLDIYPFDVPKQHNDRVYDTLQSALDAHMEHSITQGDGKKYYKVVTRLEKRTKPKVSDTDEGPIMSFEYIFVSKKEVPNPFKR